MDVLRQRNINVFDEKSLEPSTNNEGLKTDSNHRGTDQKHTMYRKVYKRKMLSILLRVLFWAFVIIYIVIPLTLRFSTTLQRNLIFLSFVRWPFFLDLTKPEKLGLPATCNFYLESSEAKLGVWHILPSNMEETFEKLNGECEKSLINDNHPVILYAHGNSGTRGGPHRIELYQILRKLDYHIITFDYRGYADSSNISPDEEGVIHDTTFVYKWLRKRVKNAPLILWGHSLGTGVATATVKQLCQENDPPLGLILESPFNNLRDEIRNHWFATFYRIMPYFDEFVLDSVERNLKFASDESIKYISIPILILHAEDDKVVPLHLGEKLYEAALQSRPENSANVSFYKFDAKYNYGHRFICRAPELSSIVRNFVDKCK